MTGTTTTKPKQTSIPAPPTGDVLQYIPGNVYTKAFDWITRLDVPLSYRMVLCLLIRMCGRSGQKSCGRKFIAKKLNLSERTVTRAVLHWEQAGFFTVIRRYQRKRKTNLYIMHPDAVKTAWLEVERREALAEIVHFVKSDKSAACKDRHEYKTCRNTSSARTHVRVHAREETLSASTVSAANETVDERKAIIGEIVEIRNQLHQTNPDKYPEIISPKAYTGKLGSKSTQELKTELDKNRKVLENSKKPASERVSYSGQNSGQNQTFAAKVKEREEVMTGCSDPWYLAWMSLDEAEQAKWREQAEARLWNDSGWDEWCEEHPDPVDQELGRRRATRNLFRYEWEQFQQYQQDIEQIEEVAEPVKPVEITTIAEPVTFHMVSPASQSADTTTGEPDCDPPPTAPKSKRRHRTRRQPTMSIMTSHRTHEPHPATENRCPETAGMRVKREPGSPLAAVGNVLPFRSPNRQGVGVHTGSWPEPPDDG